MDVLLPRTADDADAVYEGPLKAYHARWLAGAFGVVTVAINMCDVTSDIVVAIEFYNAGRTLWFWLVMASLIVASIIYAIFGALIGTEYLGAFECLKPLPTAFVTVLLLPIAQFFPIIHLVHGCRKERFSLDSCVGVSLLQDATLLRERAKRARRASKEALLSAARDLDSQGNLANAFGEHFDTYFPFYIESAVEALPQAAIQIVAVTYFNEASPAQIVSICLSLMSVMSKLVAILRSFDVKLTVFRVLCGMHDVFGVCYILASVLAPTRGRTETVFGASMTALSAVWCWKLLLLSALYVFTVFGVGVYRYLRCEFAYQRMEVLWILLIAVVASGPALLTVECMKLSIFGWYILSKGPRGAAPEFRLLADFLTANLPFLSATIEQGSGTRVQAVRSMDGINHIEDGFAPDAHRPSYFVSRRVDFALCKVLALLQSISFVYPFLNVVLHGSEQTVLQWIFFVGVVSTLPPVLLLFPHAWRRFLVLDALHARNISVSVEQVAMVIANYFASSDVPLLLSKTVPDGVLPLEVLRYEVAGYLHSEDVDVSTMTATELDALNHVEEGSGW